MALKILATKEGGAVTGIEFKGKVIKVGDIVKTVHDSGYDLYGAVLSLDVERAGNIIHACHVICGSWGTILRKNSPLSEIQVLTPDKLEEELNSLVQHCHERKNALTRIAEICSDGFALGE